MPPIDNVFFNIGLTSLELGLISSIVVLALFLSYRMLNVCDLSTDGCFTLGACVSAMVVLEGHPILSIPAAMIAGMLSGLVVSILQTKMGINSLLAGIIVNTALYSINIAIMKKSSLINLNNKETIFSMVRDIIGKNHFGRFFILIVALTFVILTILFLTFFLKTKLGLAIRATGDNEDMVKTSSINPAFTTIIGLCIANSFTALSGCLLGQMQRGVNIDIGTGMVTIALASLLIGGVITPKGGILVKIIGAVVGSIIFRVIYAIALRLDMPAFMLKLVSSVIVIFALSIPYIKSKVPYYKRRLEVIKKRGGKNA